MHHEIEGIAASGDIRLESGLLPSMYSCEMNASTSRQHNPPQRQLK